jgi:hypothetical protein
MDGIDRQEFLISKKVYPIQKTDRRALGKVRAVISGLLKFMDANQKC